MSTAQTQPQNRTAGVFVSWGMLPMHNSIDCSGRKRYMCSCNLAVCLSEMEDKTHIISLRFLFSRRYEIQICPSEHYLCMLKVRGRTRAATGSGR